MGERTWGNKITEFLTIPSNTYPTFSLPSPLEVLVGNRRWGQWMPRPNWKAKPESGQSRLYPPLLRWNKKGCCFSQRKGIMGKIQLNLQQDLKKKPAMNISFP